MCGLFMRWNILVLILFIALCTTSVYADYAYLDIRLTEKITQEVSFARDFLPVDQQERCSAIGVVNITNTWQHDLFDIYITFSDLDNLQSNFSYSEGRYGTQIEIVDDSLRTVHIPEIQGNGGYSAFTYLLDCSTNPPPLNISTSYDIGIKGSNLKTLAGLNYTVTQFVSNLADYGAMTDLNITIEALNVQHTDGSISSFRLMQLLESGEHYNVLNTGSESRWYWIPNAGMIPIGDRTFNISYVVQAPASVPTSQSYQAIRNTNSYSIPYLASDLKIHDIKAKGSLDLMLNKSILEPSTTADDAMVVWKVDAQAIVPFNITYNLTRVSFWVTSDYLPFTEPVPPIRKNITPNLVCNQTHHWIMGPGGHQPSWYFNFTDGSDNSNPRPAVHMSADYHLYPGRGQIHVTNTTQGDDDTYIQYIYIIDGYWLQIDKNISSRPNNIFDITVFVQNIGTGWTPRDLVVTAYDFVPLNFSAYGFNYNPSNSRDIQAGPQGFSGTVYQWDLGLQSPQRASLGPCRGEDAVEHSRCSWTLTYSLQGEGQYSVSELYIVGLDPRLVDGASAYQGIDVSSEIITRSDLGTTFLIIMLIIANISVLSIRIDSFQKRFTGSRQQSFSDTGQDNNTREDSKARIQDNTSQALHMKAISQTAKSKAKVQPKKRKSFSYASSEKSITKKNTADTKKKRGQNTR